MENESFQLREWLNDSSLDGDGYIISHISNGSTSVSCTVKLADCYKIIELDFSVDSYGETQDKLEEFNLDCKRVNKKFDRLMKCLNKIRNEFDKKCEETREKIKKKELDKIAKKNKMD